MQQNYRYGDPHTATPHAGVDGSRVISFFIFNTDVHMHAYPADGQDITDLACAGALDAALDACRVRCLEFEYAFSRTRPDSDIARAHAASPDPVPVDPRTAELVELAFGYYNRNGVQIDITKST